MKEIFSLNEMLHINKPVKRVLLFVFSFHESSGVTISSSDLPWKQSQFGPFLEKVSREARIRGEFCHNGRIHVFLLLPYPRLSSSDLQVLQLMGERRVFLVHVATPQEPTWGTMKSAGYRVRQN